MRGTELRKVAAIVLVIGLTCAGTIYFTAAEQEENATIYEMGVSKQYVRELRRFGGKASVLFDEFQTWFAARWHGKALGVTLAWITVAVSGAVYLAGRPNRR
ncbi:MAG: hypothetical protein QOD26_1202 [Betaproteobacteria bacterium]|jgi:hypothetical protein|nr:hypothetical protein [Betaproteobacteria bacterium]